KKITTVSCGHDNYLFIWGKPIHLHKNLVQGLFSFIMGRHNTCRACASNRIDFINEDNRRGIFFGGGKQISCTGSTNSYQHFHKLGTSYREEGNISLTGNSLSK